MTQSSTHEVNSYTLDHNGVLGVWLMRILFVIYLLLLPSMQADTSTRGSEVDSECVMDFTSEFTTYEVTIFIVKPKVC